jgi:hypothetical protein
MAGIGSLGETPRPLVAAAGLRPQIGQPDRGRQPNALNYFSNMP